MFHHIPEGPQPAWKRPIYLVASVILGALLGFLLTLLMSYFALQSNATSNTRFTMILSAIIVASAIGGFFIGRIWWQFIYVDRRWANWKKSAPPAKV